MNEKKYNEALEQAKKELATCCSMDCDAARLIFRLFPQLRESEDERIRKAVVSLVYEMKGTYQSFAKVELDNMVAWLEKQKEQKPAEWSEEDEDMLNSCISSIEEAKENRYAYKETDGDTSYDHEIEWLKSLRPYKK